jgi:hypothetical protein
MFFPSESYDSSVGFGGLLQNKCKSIPEAILMVDQ